MADYDRITEDGDTRITQGSDTRITEEGITPPYTPWGLGHVFVSMGGSQTLPGVGVGQVFVFTGGFQSFEAEED